MGRPTKSPSLYTQCVGRGLRPLPGVIDGLHTDFDRKTAIFTSDKANCLILDFVGASRCGVVDCYDVLGGNYSAEVRELARQNQENKSGKPADVNEEDLEIAKHVVDMRTELARRRAVVVDSRYSLEESDFTRPSGSGVTHTKRGTATDNQISYLFNLGVPRETASTVSRAQAGAMIGNLVKSRCLTWQEGKLRKAGLNPKEFNVETARIMLERIGRGEKV